MVYSWRMETLLQRAKKIKSGHRGKMSGDEIDLAVAWAKGEISLLQVKLALGMKGGSDVYVRLAIALRAYIQKKV
jgi:hypothetical protein